MPLTNGQTFAGYTIIRMLGSGGMGEVYLAQHPRLPRRDALKLLPREWSADEEFRARFAREADLASTLWHPHIVGVHDRGEEEGQLWLSMDFVDGLDAARLLAERYPAGMPVEEVVRIITAVASALDYAHKQHLLHRDVKPANIMMTHLDGEGEQRILLTDFGIARNVNDISGLTKTNFTVGTVAYAAPEQLLGEDIDGRADQYSLAATAFHLLTGSRLFENSNPAVVISRHLNVSPPALSDLRPALAKFDPVLTIGLAKRPEDRFERCSDFARALSGQIDSANGTTTSAPTASTPRATPAVEARARPPWRRAAFVAVLVVVLLVASIGAAVFLLRPSGDNRAQSSISTAAPAAPAITFESMRDFVTGYYADLPARPADAWAKLDTHCQNQTGQSKFTDFWAMIQSVTVLSVSPRDASSVVAELKYLRHDGTTSTENRWLRVTLVNGVILLDESDRVGSTPSLPSNASTAMPSASVPPGAGGMFPASAMDTVLLTPAEINTLVASSGDPLLPIKQSTYGMLNGSSLVNPASCVGVIFTGDRAVFDKTGFTAMHSEILEPSGFESTPGLTRVEQTVVVYSTAEQAQNLLALSQRDWKTCAAGHVNLRTVGQNGENGKTFEFGDVQLNRSMLSLKMIANSQVSGGGACQQVMAVRANVLVGIRSCRNPDLGPGQFEAPVSSVHNDAVSLAEAVIDKITA